jgi:NAD(P)-dependent dehydrogenase (short-subunit alcohol dehydrogenase family)
VSVQELDGRTAVVIGGGGIGRGISLGLAREGMRVVVADVDAGTALAVQREIASSGGFAIAHQVDATSRQSLSDLVERTTGELGAVHVLCNTVGVIVDRRLDAATDTDWAWFLEFNIMAIVRAVDVFLPALRAHHQPAHIVNTSSMAGLLALPPPLVGGYYNGLYTTTKHALIGYCDMLRGELEPEGIGVSVLCPGLVVGNLSSTAARNRPDRFGGPLPDPRAGRPPSPDAMPGELVGPIVVRGIKDNRFYIFTHPGSVSMVRQRHEQVLDDFAFYAGSGD